MFGANTAAALSRPSFDGAVAALKAIPLDQIAWSLLVPALVLLAGLGLGNLTGRLVERWVARSETKIDDLVPKHVLGPIRLLIPLMLLRATMPLYSLPPSLHAWLRQALVLVLIIAVGWLAIRALRAVAEVVALRLDIEASDNLRARAVQTQVSALRGVASFLVGVLTIGFALMTFEQVRQLGTGILASAGIAGVVLGFAAQKSLGAILAGNQLALTQPIRVDDVVIIEGEWGRIEEITLTYIVVRIWDKRRLVVPIQYILERPFQNWTRTSADLLGTVDLHLDYSVPIQPIRHQLKKILGGTELWDGEVCSVQVTAADQRSMVVRPLFSARNPSDQWDLRCLVREELLAFVQREYPGSLPHLRTEVTTQLVSEQQAAIGPLAPAATAPKAT